jgi:hypothetical protein
MSRKIPLEEVLANFRHTALNFRIEATDIETRVKFSLNDFLYKQPSIVALWMELNRLSFRPVAKTFLGRIYRITIKEY